MTIVVTLPICMDARYLESSVHLLERVTPTIASDFVVLIAEDGSNSSEVVRKLKDEYPNIVYFQSDERLGRGKALREAWRRVDGDVYLFMDVDCATDLTRSDAYRNLIENIHEFDLVTGSRYVQGSVTERPWFRRFASLVYNLLVRLLFQTGIHDHQCGFKSFSKTLVERLSKEARNDSWFWDTEVIVLAKKRGFRILEIPIHWVEVKSRKTSLKRLAMDTWLHGTGLLELVRRIYFPSERRG